MGKIQDLYDARVRPMVPAERLQLARLILDDLATADTAIDVSDKWGLDDVADIAPNLRSPHLARPEQSIDFVKQIVEIVPDAKL